MDAENLLISKIVKHGDLRPVLDAKVTGEFFGDEEHRTVFAWVLQHWSRYGKVPGTKALKSEFPAYTLVDGKEPYEYYLDELKRRRKYELAFEMFVEGAGLLEEDDVEGALDAVAARMLKIHTEVTELRDTNLMETWEDRIARYDEWREFGDRLRGIPSGFPTLDRVLRGFQEEQLITFVGVPKAGKAHPYGTRILTPAGWVNIEDLSAGDLVVGSNGEPTTVVGTVDHGEHAVVTFRTDDGRQVDVSPEHEWRARPRRTRRWTTLETQEIARLVDSGETVHIPVVQPVVTPDVDLPLDPYALGVLLGDGGFTQSTVTFTNSDGLEKFLPFELSRMGDRNQWRVKGARPVLAELGLHGHPGHEKFVPPAYLTAGTDQRRALLAGLLDTDGGVSSRSIEYATSSPQLRDDVAYLVRSLGGTVRISSRTPWFTYKGERHEGRTSYRMLVRLPFVPFRLARHQERYAARSQRHRDIVLRVESVVSKPPQPVRCIEVAAEDGLYVTEDFLLTHNSTMLMRMAIAAHEYGKVPLFIGFEMSNEEQEARHDAMIAGISYPKLLEGRLPSSDRAKLAKALRRQKEMHPFILSSDIEGATVSGVAAKIEQYKPHIVFVDGVYLMDDEEGEEKGSPQALTHITRSLKRLAQRTRTPIIITTQVLLWKLGKKGLHGGAIGYSSSFLQDSDVIMGVEHTGEEDDPIKKVSVLEARAAPKRSVLISWDWNTGTFVELDDAMVAGTWGVGPSAEEEEEEEEEDDSDRPQRRVKRVRNAP